ncbi:MAG: hypothetical protein CMJ86_02775 [Planctomycetes bacterium]|nr:hypothetical protein [Planctomycetota bacterium]
MLHFHLLRLFLLALLLNTAAPSPGIVQDEDPVLGYHLYKVPGLTVITQWHSERNRETLAQQAGALASAAWLRAQETLGLTPTVCSPSITLELHNGRRAFVQAARGLTGKAPDKQVASFSDLSAGFALITVAPVLPDRVHEIFGLPPASLRMACEEMLRLGLQQRLPDLQEKAPWLSEGLVRWCVQETMVANGVAKLGTQEPGLCRERAALHGLSSDQLPSLPMGGAPVTAQEGVLCHLALEWLAQQEQGDQLLSKLGRGDLLSETAIVSLLEMLGEQPSATLAEYLGQLEFPWDERAPAMTGSAFGLFQVPSQGKSAVCFRSQPVGFTNYRIEGDVMLFPGARSKSQMNIFLGLDGESYLSVAITQSAGVTVFVYDPEKDTFSTLARNLKVPVRLYDPTSFVIEVKNERLFVVVNGVSVESVELMGRAMDGPMGFGAQRHGAGLWVRHQVKSLD